MTSTQPQWDIVTSVGLTALAVAAGRAIETRRPDALIRDDLAAGFVAAAEPPVPMPTSPEAADDIGNPMWPSLADYMALRTRYLDELLLGAGASQVVILAAGLDARAHRLDWPTGSEVFEVDQPKVLEFKQHVLDAGGARPSCHRHAVPADLRDDWPGALAAAGFDPARPTAWLAEGLLRYLPARAEEDLFEAVHRLSAPGSVIGASKRPRDDDGSAAPDYRRLASVTSGFGVDVGQLWDDEPRRDCAAWLEWAGWRTADARLEDLQRQYARPLREELADMMGPLALMAAHLPPP